MLFQSGEYSVLCFSDVVFIAGGACDNVNDIAGAEGKCAECGECCFTVGV